MLIRGKLIISKKLCSVMEHDSQTFRLSDLTVAAPDLDTF